MTFLSVPAIVFAAGGNFTYLQLAIGSVLARIIIGVWFVPAYYAREIYSPYDYMGQRLGRPVHNVTSGLFMLGGVLAQSARVLLTAVVLEQISGFPLWASIWIIGAIAIVWTLLGGMTTVIWTDVIQFFVFALGLVVALVFIVAELPGGWGEVTTVAGEAGKFKLWDLSCDPHKAFTLWTALLANTVLCLGAYGTDQLIAQRMFCCRGAREARKAIIASSVGLVLTALALTVGAALYAYYQHSPMSPAAVDRVGGNPDSVFPIFIIERIPAGLTGLIIAGVFAAAISSLDSILAALSQTVVTGFYRPWRQRRRPEAVNDDRHYVRASRVLVVFWGIVLCAMALVAELARKHYGDILSLALAMATYTAGGMLGALFLSLFRLNVDYRGIVHSAPLSVVMVLAVSWHAPWAVYMTIALVCVILAAWLVQLRVGSAGRLWVVIGQTALLFATAALAVFICAYRSPASGKPLTVAWPWNVPIGLAVAFPLGYLLARRRPPSGDDEEENRQNPPEGGKQEQCAVQ